MHRWPLTWALLASLVAHGGLVLTAGSFGVHRTSQTPLQDSVQVEFVVVSSPQRPSTVALAEETAAPEPRTENTEPSTVSPSAPAPIASARGSRSSREVRLARDRGVAPLVPGSLEQSLAVDTAPSGLQESALQESALQDRSRLPSKEPLDPAGVRQSEHQTREATQAGTSPTRSANGSGPISFDPRSVAKLALQSGALGAVDGPETDEEREAAMAARLNAELSTTAPRHLSKRPPPRLRRTRDGGYRFDGSVFSARILPDGRVVFSDRRADFSWSQDEREALASDALHAESYQAPQEDAPAGTGFRFDLNSAVMRAAGMDPHQAERGWFMRETESVRDRLAEAYRAREQERGLERLRARLREIWRGDEDASRRRRRLFEIWDGCAEDDHGNRAREIVIRFIRRVLPPSTPDAFSETELRQLNEGRSSAAVFSPNVP
ncbi:MAG: hypothetical protein AAF355_10055 [Myxococcota bacterium]